jgi:YidC/Oxa1 family membrane protein insertase
MKPNWSRMVVFAIVYAAVFLLFQRYMAPLQQQQQQKKPPVAQTQSQYQKEIDDLLTQARTGGASLSRSEREQKYLDATRLYDKIAGLDPKSDTAIGARFDKAALLEELARMDGQSNKHLDQADLIYKELKKQFPHRSATVSIDGKTQPINVYEVANSKLEVVLKQRGARARSHILYKVVDVLVSATGRIPSFSYWFALLLLVLIVKGVLYPFSKKQYKNMQEMQRVAPLIKEAQEKLKGRPAQEIQQRVMAIYRENNVNMAAGCLPAVVQMAALFPLYYAIRYYEYAFREGHFAWIGSALADKYHPYLGRNLAEFDLPLFVMYLLSMLMTSRMTPPPADPQQAQQQKMMMYMMPLLFGWFMYSAQWPSAFTFYWLVLNLVSAAQQYYILKQHPPIPIVPASPSPPSASGGGNGGNGRNGSGGAGGGSAKLVGPSRPRRKVKR